MTAAVGSAAPGGADVLRQVASVKTLGGNRNRATHSEESTSPSENAATSQNPASDEIAASNGPADRIEKTSKRKHEDAKSDDDSSFEDTFDDLGQDPKADASGKSATATTAYMPDLAIASMTSSDAIAVKADAAPVSTTVKPAPIGSTALLQQKSMLAMLDTKDRLFANVAEQTPQAAVDDNMNIEEKAAAHSDNATDEVSVTVTRQETHWNFASNAMATSVAQLAASQSSGRESSQTSLVQVAAAKGQSLEVKPSSDTPQPATTQPLIAIDPDQPQNSAFSSGGRDNQGGSQPQSQTLAAASTERTSAKVDTSSSLDQIFSTGANPQQGLPNVTTQVRDGVIDSLGTNNPGPSPNNPMTDVPTGPKAAPVLRTLDLTLSPPDLGSVKLRMSLKSNSLTIEAEASKASTAKLLNDDKQNLERGLKDAGYDVSSLKIADTSASNSSNANGWQTSGQPGRDGDQPRSNFSGRHDGEMQRDGSSSNEAQRRPKNGNQQTTPADAPTGRSGDAVYI